MVNFSLIQHHKYSLTEIENMIPWEKEIYVNLLLQHLEQEKLRIQQEANDRKAAGRSATRRIRTR
jgi:hypothetical protein